jgi:hypothetical protein
MPTAKPRIQVTLMPATYAQLSSLAKQQSRSRGSIAAEMLNELLPQVGAAYALVQDLSNKSPGEIAKLRRMAKDLDQFNARMFEDELKKRQVDLEDVAGVRPENQPATTRPAQIAGTVRAASGKAVRPAGAAHRHRRTKRS